MVIVAQGNGWWIESFVVTPAAVADQAARTTTHTLERAGVYLGSTTSIDHTTSAPSSAGLTMIVRATGGEQLTIGQNIEALNSLILNDSGASSVIGETIMVFLRKP